MFRLLSAVLVVAALSAQSLHTGETDAQLIARLEQRIPALMKEGDVPGLSVGLIRHGDVVWHRGFGHVLTHTTGLQNWPNGALKTWFTPGERFSYSGEGFVRLSRVVERVTGVPTNEFMRRTVFEPLGMTNS